MFNQIFFSCKNATNSTFRPRAPGTSKLAVRSQFSQMYSVRVRVKQVGDFATAIYSRIFRPRARGTSCVFQRHRQEVIFFVKRLFYLQGVMGACAWNKSITKRFLHYQEVSVRVRVGEVFFSRKNATNSTPFYVFSVFSFLSCFYRKRQSLKQTADAPNV